MLSDADLQSKITTIFREIFDDDKLEVHDAMTARDVVEWDSLNHINLIVRIEKEFKTKFTTSEVSGMKNVGDLKTLLRKHNV